MPGNVVDTGAVGITTTDPAPALLEFMISQGTGLGHVTAIFGKCWEVKVQGAGVGERIKEDFLKKAPCNLRFKDE